MSRYFICLHVLLLIMLVNLSSCSRMEIYENGSSSFSTIVPINTRASSSDVFVDSLIGRRPLPLDTLSNGVVVERLDTLYIYQGDMVYRPSELSRISSPQTRALIKSDTDYYWPGCKVYYKFDNNFSSSYRTTAINAMNAISDCCGIVFREKTSTDPNYILFKYSSSANNSLVGMCGGSQDVNIHTNTEGTIIHELLHALCFYHEHTRSDRDDYVIINWDNIRPGKRHNFQKDNSNRTDIGPFDFQSIMMYPGTTTDDSFVYDTSVPMMTTIDGESIESNYELSYGDICGLRSVYGPPFHRMETRVDEVLTEDYTYTEEIYEVRKTSVIKFYSSPQCTERMCTQYPRKIKVVLEEHICESYNNMYTSQRSYDIDVPAGVDSVFVSSYVNYEDYLYSNPYEVHTYRYSIKNHHVGDIHFH